MIKNVADLNKREKVLLIKSIANGDIKKEKINDDTLVCIQKGDMFLGVMIAGNLEQDSSSPNLIFIGEARDAKLAFFSYL